MSLRPVWVVLALCAIGWWFSPVSPRVPSVAAASNPGDVRCPMPMGAVAGSPPLQSAVPASLTPFRLQAATLQPLAGMSIEARVLSREDYSLGREADLSPTDLVLGWQRMDDDTVLSRLKISQASRWYRYQWQGAPPLPPAEIARSSANMHMIPFDEIAAGALRRIQSGQRVRIDGWLVEAVAPDGWRWRSSLSRDDQGDGACEVVFVCAITPL